MIPKKRFDKVNQKYKSLMESEKSLRHELEDHQYLYTQSKDQVQQLEGQLKEANKEIKQQKERTQTLEKTIQALTDYELDKIPEIYHDLIPENLSVEEKLRWIVKAKEKGLFSATIIAGTTKIGEPTNHKQRKNVDYNKMSAFELLSMGYGQK